MRQIAYKFKIKYDPPDVIASIIDKRGWVVTTASAGAAPLAGSETATELGATNAYRGRLYAGGHAVRKAAIDRNP